MTKQFDEVVLIRTKGAEKIHRYPIGEDTVVPMPGDVILYGGYGDFKVLRRSFDYRARIIYVHIE